MFLSYFLSHFTTLNLLFCNLYLIMLMSEINVDTLQLSVVFQSLTLSALFPICGFVNFFSKYKLFFFFSREDVFPSAGCLKHDRPWLQLITQFSTWGFSNHPYNVKPPIQCELTIQCEFRLQTYVRALRYMTSCVRIFPLHSESRIETANILRYLLGLISTPSLLWGDSSLGS